MTNQCEIHARKRNGKTVQKHRYGWREAAWKYVWLISRVKFRLEVLLSAMSLNLASGSVLLRIRLVKHATGSVLSDLAAKIRPGSDNFDLGAV